MTNREKYHFDLKVGKILRGIKPNEGHGGAVGTPRNRGMLVSMSVSRERKNLLRDNLVILCSYIMFYYVVTS